MSKLHTTPRRAAAAAGVVLVIVLVIVAVGYPDWLWFPLTIAFWAAVLTLAIALVLKIRSHLVRSRSS